MPVFRNKHYPFAWVLAGMPGSPEPADSEEAVARHLERIEQGKRLA